VTAVDFSFVKGQFTEAELESAIVTLFEQQGYEHTSGETIHRRYEDILLEDDLRAYLANR
jgi:type I restriction enzyme R subunit